MLEPDGRPYYARSAFRLLSAAFGMVLACTGAYALHVGAGDSAVGLAVSIGLLLLGVDAIAAAWNARLPWVARIGPLP